METRNGLTLMDATEFETWIASKQVARTVLYIQQHHTYIPNYSHFNGSNHFQQQQGMKNSHLALGWGDIAQHFSIFPDGKICTGRSLEWNPAGIYGFNNYAICIENVGYFDTGKDNMTTAQADSIVRVTAALCKRFSIPVNTDRIVYHHWFDLQTGARRNGQGVTKTCPGTNFFGGNSVAAAQSSFLPLVQAKVNAAAATTNPAPSAILKYGVVNAEGLRIRTGPDTSHTVINEAVNGAVVRIYEIKNGWYRISSGKQEWISGRYVADVKRATVNADILFVRCGPGKQFDPPLGKALKGEEVFIYAESNGWCKIGRDERWVSKDYLTLA